MIDELLKDHQDGHSTFQQDYFITGQGATPYAAYKQCLREIAGRHNQVERLTIENRILSRKIKRTWGKDRRALKVLERIVLQQKIVTLERELERFVEQGVALKHVLGNLTPEKRRSLEADAWEGKTLKMATIDMLCFGRLSEKTYEMLYSLPHDMMLRILSMINDKDALLSWGGKQEVTAFFPPPITGRLSKG